MAPAYNTWRSQAIAAGSAIFKYKNRFEKQKSNARPERTCIGVSETATSLSPLAYDRVFDQEDLLWNVAANPGMGGASRGQRGQRDAAIHDLTR
jgi:hypothetical protein